MTFSERCKSLLKVTLCQLAVDPSKVMRAIIFAFEDHASVDHYKKNTTTTTATTTTTTTTTKQTNKQTDKKSVQPKLGGNRFMGVRNMAA